MKNISILSILMGLLFSLPSQAQVDEDPMHYWKILSKVSYTTKLDAESGEIIRQPYFSKAITKFEGKTIVLKGYIIPAELSSGIMTLSAFPYSSCFFCGGAGPESVIEVDAATPIIYRMDKPVYLQGKLKLNRTDPLRLMYVLEEATYYQPD